MTTRKRKKRVTTSGAWIEHGSPVLWMHLYGQWLATQPEAELTAPKGEKGAKRGHRPTTLEREAKASALARRKIDRRLLVLLERREDFREYFWKLREDAQFLAQELARQDIAENIALRRVGLHKAADRQVDDQGAVTFGDNVDHKSLEMYTRWTRDLAFPKKLEKETPPQRVVINLIGMPTDQKRLLLSAFNGEEPDEIEWEEIPNDRLLTDGGDD